MPAGSAPDTLTGNAVLALRSPSDTVTVSVAWPTPAGLTVSVRVAPEPVAPPVAIAGSLLVTETLRPAAGVSASATSIVRSAGGLSGSPMVNASSGTGFGPTVGAVFGAVDTVTVAVRLSAEPPGPVTRTQ